MSLSAMLKTNAKQALRGNWGTAILVQLVPFLLSLLSAFFSTFLMTSFGIGGQAFLEYYSTGILPETQLAVGPVLVGMLVLLVFQFFVFTPTMLGVTYWTTQLSYGRPESFRGVFHYFENGKRYLRALGFSIQLFFRQMLWSLLFMAVPGVLIVFVAAAGRITASNRMQAALFVGGTLFLLIYIGLFIVYLAYMKKYFLANYLLALDDETPLRELFQKSFQQSKGYRFSLLWFELSFIGWMFLAALFFPLMAYVLPYQSTAMAMYARYLQETSERENPTILPNPHQDPEDIYPY